MLPAVGRCAQATADVIQTMRICHGWFMHALADAACLWPTWFAKCAHTTIDVSRPWPMSPVVGRCAQATAGDAHPMRTHHGWSVQALADVACRCSTSFARCADAMSDACRPWLMPPAVGGRLLADARRPRPLSPSRCAQATVDVCRPWAMFPIVGRCAQATDDVAQSMRAWHDWCMQALADVACRWQTSFTRCAHATFNACRPWPMSPTVGRCCLLLADTSRPRSVTPIQCTHGTADASRPWLMLHGIGQRHLPDARMPRLMRA